MGEFRGHHAQLRRDWSLPDLSQAAYEPARRVDSRVISELSHPCAEETGPGQIAIENSTYSSYVDHIIHLVIGNQTQYFVYELI